MPTNLNALIRYKTINSCLFGGIRKWSIYELIDACSEALGEARGRYDSISERTIRDDIRIMRSDILGFNAPIGQERGLYFYSDHQFSILTLRITDAGLADKIYFFLLNLRTEIMHPELETILEQLCSLTQRKYEKHVLPEEIKGEDKLPKPMFRVGRKNKIFSELSTSPPEPIFKTERTSFNVSEPHKKYVVEKILTWGGIFEAIDKN